MNTCRFSIAGLLVVGVCAVGGSVNVPLHSQEPLTFDVATIRLNRTGARRIIDPELQPGGRLIATNTPLRTVIRAAYGVDRRQEVTGPALLEERVDVEAIVPAEYAPTATIRHQVPEMLKNLLTTRLKMRAQLVSREMPVYILSLARSDGQLGPRIKPEIADCKTMLAAAAEERAALARAAATNAARANSGLPELELQTPKPICGFSNWDYHSAPIGLFVDVLTTMLRRPVVDRTGLEGTYTFSLEFSTTDPLLMTAGIVSAEARVPDGKPFLQDALLQQLGLRLESGRAPIESVHVEYIEAPDFD